MINYSCFTRILSMLLDLEEFANLNRLYGLRDRIALACDALIDDVERTARQDARIQLKLKGKADKNSNKRQNSVLHGMVLEFPTGDRDS